MSVFIYLFIYLSIDLVKWRKRERDAARRHNHDCTLVVIWNLIIQLIWMLIRQLDSTRWNSFEQVLASKDSYWWGIVEHWRL